MPLALPRRTIDHFAKIKEPEDFKTEAFRLLGDLDKIDVHLNRILTIVYVGYEKTAGGIIVSREEDVYQGKVALVIKVGPTAFKDSGAWDFGGMAVHPGNWVTFRIGNSSQIELNSVPCRIVTDQYIETCVSDPRMVTS